MEALCSKIRGEQPAIYQKDTTGVFTWNSQSFLEQLLFRTPGGNSDLFQLIKFIC